MESVMGSAIERICLFVTSTFNLFIVAPLSICKQNYLILLAKIHVLKVAFKIPPIVEDISLLHLLLEVGNNEVSLLLYSTNPFTLQGHFIFTLEDKFFTKDYENTVKMILAQYHLVPMHFASVNIIYNYKESALIPNEYFVDTTKENVCELMFGKDTTAYTFQENVKDSEMKLIYRVPQKMFDLWNQLYPKNKFSHATSSQLLQNKSANILHCIIYQHNIKIILFKGNELQIVQYFDYETPLDVCYHLLNVCELFNVTISDVLLSLSGMIEENSNLYNEMYKYFLNITFTQLSNEAICADSMKEQPQHFYSNLTALALCVL